MVHDVVILGSGPAGLTAAIYNSRARLDTVVVAGREAGGQLMLTTDVENFPGFPKGVMGPQLIQDMREQAERFGTQFKQNDAIEVDVSQRPFRITLDEDDEVLEAKAVILATGASARWLGIPSEERFKGKGVTSCATCDGAFYRDVPVCVIGGGDSAMEEALFLTRFASKVTIIHRRDEFRASKIMQERALNHDKIDVIWNAEVIEVQGEDKVSGVKLLHHPDGKPKERVNDWDAPEADGGSHSELEVAGVFMAIGHVPNTTFLGPEIDRDEKGYLEVTENTRTNVEGVFAAGDVRDTRYRQAITAAAMGCMAAIDAERWLEANEH